MWTAFVICVFVWLTTAPIARGLIKSGEKTKDKRDTGVGCLFGIPAVLGMLGTLGIGLYKIIQGINS